MATSNIQFIVPGHRSPSAGYEAPFEMLEACHERVQRMLSLLTRARAYGAEHGCDEPFENALKDVMRYFDKAAPQHHLDEELHVFPSVLAMNDQGLTEIVFRLQREHKKMDELWRQVRCVLNSVMNSNRDKPIFNEYENQLMDDFCSMYIRHISDEETKIYPISFHSLTMDDLLVMSKDMMVRRGVQ